MTVPVLEQQYKDHTVQNPVTDVRESELPMNARDVHMQPIRNLKITVQVLEENSETVVETITGFASSGNIRMDSSSLIRRTGGLTMSVSDDLFPTPDSLMWFGNIIRVYAGLEDNTQHGEELNFLLGTFWIDESGYSISQDGEQLTFQLSDKMTKYDEYQLEYPLEIPPEVPISDAMRLVMEHLGETEFGEFHQLSPDLVVPYTLEYGVGENIINVIEEIRDMYMDCVCGFNLMGQFEFRQLSVQRQDDVDEPKFRFDAQIQDRSDLTLSFDESYNLKDIRNRIVVYGGTSDVTGITPVGEVRITDPNSPFNIDAIGEKRQIMIEDHLMTTEQCTSQARYAAWKASNFQEIANITTVPIYMLDAHDVIEITHPRTNERHRYMIDNFDIGLGVDNNMTINAHKMYYVSLEYGENVVELIDYFTRGIMNYGWLSLPEQRIHETFGILGSGTATLTVRFIEEELGGHQASITSYATTRNQTMLIDLADFAELDPDSSTGDNNRSTGDYADRVLGHEMFHAVENDYLGHSRSVDLPLWFREGMAEFLHGARERFNASYIDLDRETKREAIIQRAEEQLSNAWVGDNNDYAVGYVIAMAVYRLQDERQWRNMYPRLRSETNLSINFLLKLLPFLGDTNDEVKTTVLNEMRNMDEIWDMLFDENDEDTGSIGGIHFMNLYGVPLSAENVFNNANAVTDSLGFNIRIER